MRIRRLAAVGAATLVLFTIGGVSARGAEPSLFGYTLSATGTAISALYNQPSFGVPSDPTFELRHIYAQADLDSGPSAHGLGSLLWPGQVVGNAPPSLAFDTLVFNPTQIDQLTETCLSDQLPEALRCVGLNPEKKQLADATAGRSGYPVRSEAFYPSDQDQASQDVGPARMGAIAREDIADASATNGGAGLPGVITFGSVYSHSTSEVVKGIATAVSITHITDLDLFGAIHIDSLTATAIATSDGVTGKTAGSFDIGGMLIKDQEGKPQAQIMLDKTGFRIRSFDADGKPTDQFEQDPFGQLTDAVFTKNLANRGINLYIGQPINKIDGSAAERSLAGLVLHLDATGMKTLLDSMPADIRNTLKNPTSNHTISDPIFGDGGVLSPTVAGLIGSFFQGDQDMNFVFGAARVTSAASPPLPEFPLPEIPPIPPIDIGPPLTGGDLGGGFVQPPAQTPPTFQSLPLNAVGSVGIPFAALAAILLAGLIGSSRMRLFADSVISARAVVRCPMEELDK